MKVQLTRLAHARSGDKGDTANVGLIALSDELYPILVREVTAERVKQHFSEQELIDLTIAVTQINMWNRLNVAFRTVAGNYHPGMYKEWMAAAGV